MFKPGILGELWRRLTEPSVNLSEPIRRQARLLSSILLVTLLVAFPAILLQAWVEPPGLAPTATAQSQLNFVFVLCCAAIYLLSRTRYYTLAAIAMVIFMGVVTYDSAVERGSTLQLEYVLAGVIMAGLFFSLRYAVLTFALTLGAILVFPIFRPDVQVTAVLAALQFVGIFGAVFVATVIVRQRDSNYIEHQAQALTESEEHFRALIENSSDVTMLLTVDGAVSYVSPSVEHVLGYKPGDLVGKNVFEYVHPDHVASTMSTFRQALAHPGVAATAELQFRRRDNSWIYFEATGTAHSSKADELFCVVNAHDVTDRKQAQVALQHANAELTTSLHALEQHNHEISQLNMMTDDLQVCQTVEEARLVIVHSVSRLFPAQSGALYLIAPSRDILEVAATWGDAPPAVTLFAPDECWGLRRGQPYLSDERSAIRCAHVTVDSPAPTSYLCVPMLASGESIGMFHLNCVSTHAATDVHAKQQLAIAVAEHIALSLSNLKLRETLRQQSIRDSLTGLFNRRYLDETLKREIYRATRQGAPVSVVMFDIDHFKQFNDNFGHDAGDAVLQELGQFLQTHVRGEDIPCRYGGEEFMLILPGIDSATARQRIEDLQEGILSLAVTYRKQRLVMPTLSFGVAEYPEHGQNGEELLRCADAALYRAKKNGRNRVEVA